MITSENVDSTKLDKSYFGLHFEERIAEARRRVDEFIHKFELKHPGADIKSMINPDIILFELTRAGVLQYFPKSAVFNRNTTYTRRNDRIPDDIFKHLVGYNNGAYQTSFRIQNGLDPVWVGYKVKEEQQ